jgi:hypothetical protein
MAYFFETGELVDMRTNDHNSFVLHHLPRFMYDFSYRISGKPKDGQILISGIYRGVKYVEKTIAEWQCIMSAKHSGRM